MILSALRRQRSQIRILSGAQFLTNKTTGYFFKAMCANAIVSHYVRYIVIYKAIGFASFFYEVA